VLATLFLYLSIKDGLLDRNPVYSLLFVLLFIEYLIDLAEHR